MGPGVMLTYDTKTLPPTAYIWSETQVAKSQAARISRSSVLLSTSNLRRLWRMGVRTVWREMTMWVAIS